MDEQEHEPPRRRRGRPAGAGVVDPDELMDLALETLARGGYRGLSMRGIARGLGVSLASVQHRHPTKDALWRAAVDRLTESYGDEPDTSLPFPTVLRRRMDEAASYPGLLASLLADDAPGHEERMQYLSDKVAPLFASARRHLSAAMEDGLTRDIDVDVFLAVMLVGLGAVGALPGPVNDVLGLEGDAHERIADGVADLLLFGLVARGG